MGIDKRDHCVADGGLTSVFVFTVKEGGRFYVLGKDSERLYEESKDGYITIPRTTRDSLFNKKSHGKLGDNVKVRVCYCGLFRVDKSYRRG